MMPANADFPAPGRPTSAVTLRSGNRHETSLRTGPRACSKANETPSSDDVESARRFDRLRRDRRRAVEQLFDFGPGRARIAQPQVAVGHVKQRLKITQRHDQRHQIARHRKNPPATLTSVADHHRDGKAELDEEQRQHAERNRRDARLERFDFEFLQRPGQALRAFGRASERAQQRDRLDVLEKARGALGARAHQPRRGAPN